MKNVLIISFLFGSLGVVSQKQIDNQNGAWLMYFGNHKLTEKFSLHTEYQWRRSDYFNNWQQSLARVGIDYHFNKQNSVTTGYGWIVSYPYGEQPIGVTKNEHRIWQQFLNQSNSGRFYLNHRYRLEQRFIEKAFLNFNNEKVIEGFNFRQRARYRFMVSIPLNHNTMKDNTLFLGAYNEVFIGFGPGIGKNILDQNRLFGALGWKFNSKTNLQVGYLNQIIVKSDGIQIERNHNLQLSLTHNFDFSMNK